MTTKTRKKLCDCITCGEPVYIKRAQRCPVCARLARGHRRVPTPQAEFLRVPDVSAAMGRSEMWVRKHAHLLPFSRMPGGSLMMSRRALNEWFDANRIDKMAPDDD